MANVVTDLLEKRSRMNVRRKRKIRDIARLDKNEACAAFVRRGALEYF